MTEHDLKGVDTSLDNISNSINRSTNYLLVACVLAGINVGLMLAGLT